MSDSPAALSDQVPQDAPAQEHSDADIADMRNYLGAGGYSAADIAEMKDTVSAFQQSGMDIKKVFEDPVGASATIDNTLRTMRGQPAVSTPDEAQKLMDKYREYYGQAPQSASSPEEQARVRAVKASGNSFMLNMSDEALKGLVRMRNAPIALAGQIPGLGFMTQAAEANTAAAEKQFNSDPNSWGATAGQGVAIAANLAPLLVGSPSAATALFGAEGGGNAVMDIDKARTENQKISATQKFLDVGGEAIVQSLFAHYLAGSSGTAASALLSQLPKGALEVIQGTEGSIIRPILAKTLVQAGVGSATGVGQQMASNFTDWITGVDPNRDIMQGTGKAAAIGGVAGGALGLGEEIRERTAPTGREVSGPFKEDYVAPEGAKITSGTSDADVEGILGKAPEQPVPAAPQEVSASVERPGTSEILGQAGEEFNPEEGELQGGMNALPEDSEDRLLRKLDASAQSASNSRLKDRLETKQFICYPWTMTREAWSNRAKAQNGLESYLTGKGIPPENQELATTHYRIVENALDEGRTVPDKVLASYPDLAEKYNLLPVEERQSPEMLAQLRRQAQESDEILARQPKAEDVAEPLQGQLPNDTDLRTGNPPVPGEETPLMTRAKALMNSEISRGEFPEEVKQFVEDVQRNKNIAVTPVKELGAAGMASPAVDGEVLINTSNPAATKKSFLGVIAHEVAHLWQYAHPQELESTVARMPESYRNRLWNGYENRMKSAGFAPEQIANVKATQYAREVYSEAVRENVEGNGMLTRALSGNPTAYEHFRDILGKVLNSFTAKGKIINEIDAALRKEHDLSSRPAAPSEDNLAPGTKSSYLNIGHNPHHDENIFWADGPDSITEKPARGKYAVHAGGGEEVTSAAFRGRVDNTTKEISITTGRSREDPMVQRRMAAVADRLQAKYPDHKVFVDTPAGLVAHDAANLTHELRNVRMELPKDKPIKDKMVDVLNKFLPSNAVHILKSWETGYVKAVFEKDVRVLRFMRGMTDTFHSQITKLSPETFLRVVMGQGAYDKSVRGSMDNAYAGIRDHNGVLSKDGVTGSNLTHEWQFTPIIEAGKAASVDPMDLLKVAGQRLVAESTLERGEQWRAEGQDMQEPLTGISEGQTAEADVAEAKRYLAESAEHPQIDAIKELSRRTRVMGNAMVGIAYKAGMISYEAAANMIRSNQFHADMHRVMTDSKVLSPLPRGGDGRYRQFGGSNRLIDNPFSNAMQTQERTWNAAMTNVMKRTAVEHMKEAGIAERVSRPGRNTVTVFEAGKQTHYRIDDPEMAKTVQMWGENGSSIPPIVRKLLSTPGWLKMKANILSPSFQVAHFVRQTHNRLLTGGTGGAFNIDGLIASKDMFNSRYKEILDVLGGTMGGASDFSKGQEGYHKLLSRTIKELGQDPNTLLALPRKGFNGLKTLGEWADAANRTAEFSQYFKAGKAAGLDDMTAALEAAGRARALCDFSVSGTIMNHISKLLYVPFMKAELAGGYRFHELLRTNPKLAIQRSIVYGILPALAPILYAASKGKLKEYTDMPIAQRVTNSIWPIGNMNLAFPTGQSAYLSKVLVELLVDQHRDADTIAQGIRLVGAPEAALVDLLRLDLPSLTPGQSIRNVQANYDPFLGSTIVPPGENHLALDLRHVDRASPLSQSLSGFLKNQMGMELDPRQMDYIINNEIGGLASNLLQGSKATSSPLPAANNTIYNSRFIRQTPGYSRQSIQQVMKQAEYYGDTQSPQYKAMQDTLHGQFEASDLGTRQTSIDAGVKQAEDLTQFYTDHGQDIIAAKKVSRAISEARTQLDELKGAQRASWIDANPQQAALARESTRLSSLNSRISEIRKSLADPNVDPQTKQSLNKRLTELYGTIKGLGT